MNHKNIEKFQEQIHYFFKSRTLLRSALTHASIKKGGEHFERLEFLGDRVLGLVISDYLYTIYPQDKEGVLAKKMAYLVRRKTCEKVASALNVQKYIQVANIADLSNSSICSDAIEALIGAIYLDGGIEHAAKFIKNFWEPYLNQSDTGKKDSKSQLQEYLQSKNMPIPRYNLKKKEGPDHAPCFEIAVTLEDNTEIVGKGSSKQIAEQEAAKHCLEHFKKLI